MGVSGQESLEEIRSLLVPDGRLREDVERVHPQWEGRIFSVETLDVRLPDGDRGVREIVRTTRSEERRVGKECRSRWSQYH